MPYGHAATRSKVFVFAGTEVYELEVFVLTEKHSAQLTGSIEQVRVFQSRRAVKLRRQHIHTPEHESARDRRRHVHVHVKANAHVSLPISRKRFRIGDSPACVRSFSTSCALR